MNMNKSDTFANQQMEWRSVLNSRKQVLAETEKSLKRHAFEELAGETTGEISKIRLHPADLATDTQEIELLDIFSEKNTKKIHEIEDALSRIDNGTYGFCIACKDPIPPERLKALPETSYCLECQEDLEMSRTGIAPKYSEKISANQVELTKTLEDLGKVWVSEIMQPDPITVNMSESLDTAASLLSDNNIRHLPVVDHNGNIQGVISDRDILKITLGIKPWKLVDRNENMLNKTLIESVMTKNPETVTSETSLFEAGTLLLENKISCLPVVEGTRLVGIVTDSDFVKLVSQGE